MKRILSMLLCVIFTICIITLPAYADDGVTVYITVNKFGEIVSDKEGGLMALAPVTLTDSENTLDNLFAKAHELYYDGGAEEGYSSLDGDFGLSMVKLWGDTSGNFGYQVNGGTTPVYSLDYELCDGDIVDAAIYKSFYPDTESYSKFYAFTSEAYEGESVEVTLFDSYYDESFNLAFKPCDSAKIIIDGEETDYITDENGKASISFSEAGSYLVSAKKTKLLNEEEVPAIAAPAMTVNVVACPYSRITVPQNTNLLLERKDYTGYNFIPFTKVNPVKVIDNTYYFETEAEKTYIYRVSSEDYATFVGKTTAPQPFNIVISNDDISANEKNTVVSNPLANGGYNVSDVYLNINPKGYLKLENVDDTYELVNLRNWSLIDSATSNFFIEPDYSYLVVDEGGQPCDNVISIDKSGKITAISEGTAIVLVTYDAINYNEALGGCFYGAIAPENTGVFVVTVGESNSDITTNINVPDTYLNKIADGMFGDGKEARLNGYMLDSEHDVVYFTGDESKYTFTPEENAEVFVANPVIADTLSFKGFIEVSVNEDGSFSVPLKQGRNIVKVTKGEATDYQVITAKKVNVTINEGKEVKKGEEIKIVFDTLFHPANKIAGVYNMTAQAQYTLPSGETVLGGIGAMNFSSNPDAQMIKLTIPSDFEGEKYTLTGGTFYLSGYGDPYGNHRKITKESGKDKNTEASERIANLGFLPDIEIIIGEQSSGSEEKTLVAIEVTTPPTKNMYKEGSTFNPSGMVISEVYSNGEKVATDKYTYEPKRDLNLNDTEITITYTGEANVPSVKIPIEVYEGSSGGGYVAPDITVYVTVYGDDKHSDGAVHTFKNDQLKLWLEKTSVKVENGSYAIEAITKALSIAGIPYECPTGDYIESVKGLGEFDNGSTSGWMYSVNGNHPQISMADKVINNGDKIIFHYTDDFSLEEDDSVSSRPSSGLGGNTIKPNNNKPVEEENIEEEKPIEEIPVISFSDVLKTDWYYDAVNFVVEKELFKGVTETEFAPNDEMTRGMLATVIYRMENQPEITVNGLFSDIKADEYYNDAIIWANDNGIVNGVTESTFAPDEKLTREQLITIIYRYANYIGENTAKKADINGYADKKDVSSWAIGAFKWGVAAGIINGVSDDLLAPLENTTRAEVAAVLMRFLNFTK